jgi:hypothetical protein
MIFSSRPNNPKTNYFRDSIPYPAVCQDISAGVRLIILRRDFMNKITVIFFVLILAVATSSLSALQITISFTGDGTGEVQATDTTGHVILDCAKQFVLPRSCNATVTNAGVTLTVVHLGSDSDFLGFTGTCNSNKVTCQFLLFLGDASITANIVRVNKRLDLSPKGNGSGHLTASGVSTAGSLSISGDLIDGVSHPASGAFLKGTQVKLTPTPSLDSVFTGWSGGTASAASCTGLSPCTITLTGDSLLSGTFQKSVPVPLTLSFGGTGSGKFLANLTTGVNLATCVIKDGALDGSCISSLPLNSQLQFVATPDTGSTFDGWSAGTGSTVGCSGTSPCTFTVTLNSSLTVKFTGPPQSLKIAIVGSGNVAVTNRQTGKLLLGCTPGSACSGTFPKGTPLALTATPAALKSFLGWSNGTGSAGICSGQTRNPCPFDLDASSSVQSNFTN